MKMNLAVCALVGLLSVSEVQSISLRKSYISPFDLPYHLKADQENHPPPSYCTPTGKWPNPDALPENCAIHLEAPTANKPSGGASVDSLMQLKDVDEEDRKETEKAALEKKEKEQKEKLDGKQMPEEELKELRKEENESRDVEGAAKTKREKGKTDRAKSAADEEAKHEKETAEEHAAHEKAHIDAMKANNERGAKQKEENDHKKEDAFYHKEHEDEKAVWKYKQQLEKDKQIIKDMGQLKYNDAIERQYAIDHPGEITRNQKNSFYAQVKK